MKATVFGTVRLGLLLLLVLPASSYAQLGSSGWSADPPVITTSGEAYTPLTQPAYPYIYLDNYTQQGASTVAGVVMLLANPLDSVLSASPRLQGDLISKLLKRWNEFANNISS